MITPEGKVKAEIKKWLKDQGAYFFMPVQTGYGASSIDFLVCLKGHFIGIEVKRPDSAGTPSARQAIVIGRIKDAGGIAFVTKDLTKVKEMLSLHGYTRITPA